MTGTPSQIEWAEQIRRRVNAEFDRVANAFEKAAGQPEQDRMDTSAIVAIVQQKRDEVMEGNEAGYFIRDWQELRDQAPLMIGQDSAYQAIKARREARQERSDQLLPNIGRIE